MRTVISLLCILAFPALAASATILVPRDYSSIQKAIDASENGDIILVQQGTYHENICFKGRAITVRSDRDMCVETRDLAPEITVIDGGQFNSVVAFLSNETETSVLKGFTLRNGIGFKMGGVPPRRGGGVFIDEATPVIANNIISGNTADFGAGIACHGETASAYITENLIRHNHAYADGGGISCYQASAYITHNIISTNVADNSGGGIQVSEFGNSVIFNNIVKNNMADEGGGIGCHTALADIANNIIKHNTADHGGGLYCLCASPNVTNNTFYKNDAAIKGGAISCYWFCFPVITNSILWHDTAVACSEVAADYSCTLDITYCNVEGGFTGEGNIDFDPLFLCGAPVQYENLHLSPGSPCIDAGNNAAPAIGPSDFNHEPRIEKQVIDMGVDEHYAYPALELHVPSQHLTIQDAIDAAAPGSTVYVAPKFHNEGKPYTGCIDFLGKAITVVSDWDANPLTRDIDPANTLIEADDSGSVITFASGEGRDSVLDGFTIQFGTGTLKYNHYYGGGIFCCNASSPTIVNNFVQYNETDFGGGIFCDGGSAYIAGNTIEGNYAFFGGAGMELYYNAMPEVDSNIFRNNKTSSCGGGIHAAFNSKPLITNNLFYLNLGDFGGGIGTYQSAPVITNCTFFHNTGLQGGGALYTDTNSAAVVNNCILWDDQSFHIQEIYTSRNSHLFINHSNVDGGIDSTYTDADSTMQYGVNGLNMLDKDPEFISPYDGDFALHPGSPCINRGCNAMAPGHDFEGTARPDSGLVEMGAYEYTGPLPLTSDLYKISILETVTCNLMIDAGIENASRVYIMIPVTSGTAPGYSIDPELTLPLNLVGDPLFPIFPSLHGVIFKEFINQTLDSYGCGTSQVWIPHGMLGPETIGTVLYFACYLTGPVDFTSNPIGIEIVP